VFRRKYIVVISSLAIVSVLVGSLFYYNMARAQEAGEYDPWGDINDDGKIDMKDIGFVARKFGTSGEPLTKAAIEYDSGWVDITDKAGQYFTLAHNLNTTEVIVDLTGRQSLDPEGGVQEWSRAYGGTGGDIGYSLVQTVDGGYALAGYTNSYGAGGVDFWLVKTDAENGLACTGLNNNTIILYKGRDDPYWNYVYVRIWKIKETP